MTSADVRRGRRGSSGGGSDDGTAGTDELEEHEEDRHETAMRTSFERSQSASYAQWDLCAGVCVSMMLLLALPSSTWEQHWRTQLGAFVVEVGLRSAPAYLATYALTAYLPHRTPLVAACRVTSALLQRWVAAPTPPTALVWAGWAQFLLFTRTLGFNTMPWLARLPFKWFVWVQLLSVLDAGMASLPAVCSSPGYSGAEAQQQYAVAAWRARALAIFAPVPGVWGMPSQASCMEGLAVAGGGGGGGNAAWGACACRHVATWALACLGYALPVAFQFLSEAAARRAFYRSLCRRRGCERCANAKGTDLPALALSTGILLLGFCAAAWQLAGSIFTHPAVLEQAAATAAAAAAAACSLQGGECPSGV
ncbi:hypothetical protein C2E20_4980 [Micractinium conductrix]|uniref:Uncharacterized protein n=1 Tax=Micractinium conductrix TaxID=554055 RepID=A0A2P6VCK1_9CHLO|nr:hypothetical protein C2E20_4980 [Micractinium conductrix]|eukprot:PSC71809.1 hypothetical protein C2E20_4980 [Micractinium conductrix]